jgi:hypothetical protein
LQAIKQAVFPFEDYNGVLGKFLKGPNGPLIQLAIRQYLFFADYFKRDRLMSLTALQFIEGVLTKNSTTARKCNNNRRFSMIEYEGDLYRSYKKYFIDNKTISVDSLDLKSFNDSFIFYRENFYKILKILVDYNNFVFIEVQPIVVLQFPFMYNYYEVQNYGPALRMKFEGSFQKCVRFTHRDKTEALVIVYSSITVN